MSWFYPAAMGAESPLLPPSVYVNNLPDMYSSSVTAELIGDVGLHELGHYFGLSGFLRGDLAYDASNPNTMMFSNAPLQMQTDAWGNPNAALWRLSEAQVSTLFKKCTKAHPPRKPAPSKGAGGASPMGPMPASGSGGTYDMIGLLCLAFGWAPCLGYPPSE